MYIYTAMVINIGPTYFIWSVYAAVQLKLQATDRLALLFFAVNCSGRGPDAVFCNNVDETPILIVS
jgi:hypothetical protein